MHSILIMHCHCDSRMFPRPGSQSVPAGLHCHALIKDVLKTNQSSRFNNKEKRDAEHPSPPLLLCIYLYIISAWTEHSSLIKRAFIPQVKVRIREWTEIWVRVPHQSLTAGGYCGTDDCQWWLPAGDVINNVYAAGHWYCLVSVLNS